MAACRHSASRKTFLSEANILVTEYARSLNADGVETDRRNEDLLEVNWSKRRANNLVRVTFWPSVGLVCARCSNDRIAL